MPKTKSGVYYDLTESEFVAEAADFRFYFSSASHMHKFKERICEATKEFNERITKRYGINLSARIAPALALYLKIETRGFYVVRNTNGDRIDEYFEHEALENDWLWGV